MSADIIALPTNYEPCIVEIKNEHTMRDRVIRTLQNMNNELENAIMEMQNRIDDFRDAHESNRQIIEDISCRK